ncbi:MAG: hypothetical protein JO259_06265 [Mycobacterium sp.]|nr:hypothetical protein [Mycobacterium sp.]
MTSQLTPERTTSSPAKTEKTRELPVFLQPWFLMAVLSMVAIVLVALTG